MMANHLYVRVIFLGNDKRFIHRERSQIWRSFEACLMMERKR